MGKVILVTGGARSGKSLFAQELAERLGSEKIFVATCPVMDEELKERVEKHKKQREDRGWQTIEETVDLERVLGDVVRHDVVLIDCLTLWISNLLHHFMDQGIHLTEDHVSQLCRKVLLVSKKALGTVIMVTNEVGMGIVPVNPLARKYRDLLGRCNQVMAQGADEVIFMISGIPMRIKG